MLLEEKFNIVINKSALEQDYVNSSLSSSTYWLGHLRQITWLLLDWFSTMGKKLVPFLLLKLDELIYVKFLK